MPLSFWVRGSAKERPIRRLIANSVPSGLVTAWRFAAWPTRRSSAVKPTIDGVVRAPSAFSITFGFGPSMMATQEFVVPRSIPITLPITLSFAAGIGGPNGTGNTPMGSDWMAGVTGNVPSLALWLI